MVRVLLEQQILLAGSRQMLARQDSFPNAQRPNAGLDHQMVEHIKQQGTARGFPLPQVLKLEPNKKPWSTTSIVPIIPRVVRVVFGLMMPFLAKLLFVSHKLGHHSMEL